MRAGQGSAFVNLCCIWSPVQRLTAFRSATITACLLPRWPNYAEMEMTATQHPLLRLPSGTPHPDTHFMLILPPLRLSCFLFRSETRGHRTEEQSQMIALFTTCKDKCISSAFVELQYVHTSRRVLVAACLRWWNTMWSVRYVPTFRRSLLSTSAGGFYVRSNSGEQINSVFWREMLLNP